MSTVMIAIGGAGIRVMASLKELLGPLGRGPSSSHVLVPVWVLNDISNSFRSNQYRSQFERTQDEFNYDRWFPSIWISSNSGCIGLTERLLMGASSTDVTAIVRFYQEQAIQQKRNQISSRIQHVDYELHRLFTSCWLCSDDYKYSMIRNMEQAIFEDGIAGRLSFLKHILCSGLNSLQRWVSLAADNVKHNGGSMFSRITRNSERMPVKLGVCQPSKVANHLPIKRLVFVNDVPAHLIDKAPMMADPAIWIGRTNASQKANDFDYLWLAEWINNLKRVWDRVDIQFKPENIFAGLVPYSWRPDLHEMIKAIHSKMEFVKGVSIFRGYIDLVKSNWPTFSPRVHSWLELILSSGESRDVHNLSSKNIADMKIVNGIEALENTMLINRSNSNSHSLTGGRSIPEVLFQRCSTGSSDSSSLLKVIRAFWPVISGLKHKYVLMITDLIAKYRDREYCDRVPYLWRGGIRSVRNYLINLWERSLPRGALAA
jgi:hypothetical protein